MITEEEEATRIAKQYMAICNEKYKQENPCPKCGSHNVGWDINYINGPHMSGVEWCNDCGWRKETTA